MTTNAEPIAAYGDAVAMRDGVARGNGSLCGHCDVDPVLHVWNALINSYPEPISVLDLPSPIERSQASRHERRETCPRGYRLVRNSPKSRRPGPHARCAYKSGTFPARRAYKSGRDRPDERVASRQSRIVATHGPCPPRAGRFEMYVSGRPCPRWNKSPVSGGSGTGAGPRRDESMREAGILAHMRRSQSAAQLPRDPPAD